MGDFGCEDTQDEVLAGIFSVLSVRHSPTTPTDTERLSYEYK